MRSPTAGLLVGLVLGGICVSLFQLPWCLKINVLKIARDAGVIFLVNAALWAAYFSCVQPTGVEGLPKLPLLALAFIITTMLFGIVAFVARKHTLTHLGYVLIGIWLLSACDMLVEEKVTVGQWILRLPVYAVTMWLGYWLARQTRKIRSNRRLKTST